MKYKILGLWNIKYEGLNEQIKVYEIFYYEPDIWHQVEFHQSQEKFQEISSDTELRAKPTVCQHPHSVSYFVPVETLYLVRAK